MVTVCPPFPPVGESQSLVSSPASSVHDVRDTPESHIVDVDKPPSERNLVTPISQIHFHSALCGDSARSEQGPKKIRRGSSKSKIVELCVGTLHDLNRDLKNPRWSYIV